MRLLPMAIGFALVMAYAPSAQAAEGPLTYRYQHHIVTVPAKTIARWQEPSEAWTLYGHPFTPPSQVRVDGDEVPPLPRGVERTVTTGWNREAIKASLAAEVAFRINRTPGSVTITRSGSGTYAFEGIGFPGRTVDVDLLASLTIRALEDGVSDITIPVAVTQPLVIAKDGLGERGVKELVAFGESEFAGSPANRRHNIAVGLKRFNGHLVEQGETFSFVQILGNVDGEAGYKKELVIKGDRTEPDYGGGLCQVSTTAYRGVWEAWDPLESTCRHASLSIL